MGCHVSMILESFFLRNIGWKKLFQSFANFFNKYLEDILLSRLVVLWLQHGDAPSYNFRAETEYLNKIFTKHPNEL